MQNEKARRAEAVLRAEQSAKKLIWRAYWVLTEKTKGLATNR